MVHHTNAPDSLPGCYLTSITSLLQGDLHVPIQRGLHDLRRFQLMSSTDRRFCSQAYVSASALLVQGLYVPAPPSVACPGGPLSRLLATTLLSPAAGS